MSSLIGSASAPAPAACPTADTPAACARRARSQRLLESTWDDLLARQAAEAQAAHAFAAWIAPELVGAATADPALP